MRLARCIIKQAEKPPLFIETTKYSRIAAARELLGNSTSPEFYSLTPDNSFVIAYDFYGLFRDQPINFFVTPPVGRTRPVLPVVGDAVILRCEPISDFTDSDQDYHLIDCTEDDMEYIKTGLLKNAIQNVLYGTAERMVKEVSKEVSHQHTVVQLMTDKLSRWSKIHDRTVNHGFIGKAVNPMPAQSIQRSKEADLRDKPFQESSFIRYCEGWGLVCTCPMKGIVLIKSKSAYWKIWHNNCFVVRMAQSSINVNIQGGRIEAGEYSEVSIPERDIFQLAKHISKIGRYGLS